jgi:hypothetical protein
MAARWTATSLGTSANPAAEARARTEAMIQAFFMVSTSFMRVSYDMPHRRDSRGAGRLPSEEGADHTSNTALCRNQNAAIAPIP